MLLLLPLKFCTPPWLWESFTMPAQHCPANISAAAAALAAPHTPDPPAAAAVAAISQP
jgi:hypothetical protein